MKTHTQYIKVEETIYTDSQVSRMAAQENGAMMLIAGMFGIIAAMSAVGIFLKLKEKKVVDAIFISFILGLSLWMVYVAATARKTPEDYRKALLENGYKEIIVTENK